MVLISHEDLMTSQEYMSWEINGGQFVAEDPSKSICQRLWDILNSKTANTIIVLATIVEALVILAELLINLRIIQDPYSPPQLNLCNCATTNGSGGGGGVAAAGEHTFTTGTTIPSGSSSAPLSSRNIRVAKYIFTYISISLLALFLFEILLRILTGKGKFFKQTVEVCDGIVVVVAFSLDLAFLVTSPKEMNGQQTTDGRVASLLIILLRLWRISRLVQNIIHDAKRGMGHIINAYKRDKIQAEHKVEILILKVEDLEHEVAYLKEKLKKTEKDAAALKKRKGREMDSSCSGLDGSLLSLTNPDSAPWRSSLFPVLSLASLANSTHTPCTTPPPQVQLTNTASLNSTTHTPLATSPTRRGKSPRRRRRKSQDVTEIHEFARSTVDTILQSASIELDTLDEEERRGQRVEQHDSGRGSSYTPGSTPRVSTLKRVGSSGRQSPIYSAPDDEILNNAESKNERDKESKKEEDERGEVHHEENGGDQLDEISEIERVKKIEFQIQEGSKDIPVTAL